MPSFIHINDWAQDWATLNPQPLTMHQNGQLGSSHSPTGHASCPLLVGVCSGPADGGAGWRWRGREHGPGHTMQHSSTYHVMPSAMPCRPHHAMPCLTMPCHAMPCNAMQCLTMPCNASPCHAKPCKTTPQQAHQIQVESTQAPCPPC